MALDLVLAAILPEDRVEPALSHEAHQWSYRAAGRVVAHVPFADVRRL